MAATTAPWDEPPARLDAPSEDAPSVSMDAAELASIDAGAAQTEPWESGPPPGFDEAWDDGVAASPVMASQAVGQPAAAGGGDSASVAPTVSLSRQLAALPPDPLSDRWAEVVAQMQSRGLITALVRELAVQSQCMGQREEGGRSVWQLQVPRASLCGDMHKERLTQALAQLLAQEVLLEVTQGPAVNTPAQRDQAAREARQHAAEALIEGDALVRGLLAQYPGARIVPGSVAPL